MKLLLTSFTTWLPHQKSNSSDDLLAIISNQNTLLQQFFLRQLPVNVDLASNKAIATINQVQPQGIICCGMAESRKQLSIESHATYNNNCLQTTLNLSALISQLSHTFISHDAGKFVCEGLYYRVLEYLKKSQLSIPCIFVHVPVLNRENKEIVLQDFQTILEYFRN